MADMMHAKGHKGIVAAAVVAGMAVGAAVAGGATYYALKKKCEYIPEPEPGEPEIVSTPTTSADIMKGAQTVYLKMANGECLSLNSDFHVEGQATPGSYEKWTVVPGTSTDGSVCLHNENFNRYLLPADDMTMLTSTSSSQCEFMASVGEDGKSLFFRSVRSGRYLGLGLKNAILNQATSKHTAQIITATASS